MPTAESLKRYGRAYDTRLTATLTENADGTITQRQTTRTQPSDPLVGQFVVFSIGTTTAKIWAGAGIGQVIEAMRGGYYLVHYAYGNAGPAYGKHWGAELLNYGCGFTKMVSSRQMENAAIFPEPGAAVAFYASIAVDLLPAHSVNDTTMFPALAKLLPLGTHVMLWGEKLQGTRVAQPLLV